MAADAQQGHSKKHWTEDAGVIGIVLLAALAPLVGLALIVPCFVAAKRAGTTTMPYVIALALSATWTVGIYAVQSQIKPV